MPTYIINGRRVNAEAQLSDDEIDEIASSFGEQPEQVGDSQIPTTPPPGQPPPPSQPVEPDYAGGLVKDFGKALGGAAHEVGDVVKGLGTAALEAAPSLSTNPEDIITGKSILNPVAPFLSPLRMAGGIAKGLGEGVVEGVSKHARAFQDAAPDDLREKAAQALMTAGSVVPGMSQMFDLGERAVGMAGDQASVLDADPEAAGRLGAQLGLAGMEQIPGLAKQVPGVNSLGKFSEGFMSPVDRFASALRPSKANRQLATSVAEEAIERNISGGLGKLRKTADSGMDDIGRQLDEAWERGDPNAEWNISRMRQAVNDWKGTKSAYGKPVDPSIEKAALEFNMYLDEISGGAESLKAGSEARKLRQILDDNVARKKGYLEGADPNLVAGTEVKRAAADNLREQLAERYPETAPLNKSYKFYADLGKLVEQRNSPLLRHALKASIGTAVGAVGLGAGMGAGAFLVPAAILLIESPWFKTMSAVKQTQLARALQSGAMAEASQLANEAGGSLDEVLQAPNQWGGLERPQGASSGPSVGLKSPNDVVLDRMELEGTPSVYTDPKMNPIEAAIQEAFRKEREAGIFREPMGAEQTLPGLADPSLEFPRPGANLWDRGADGLEISEGPFRAPVEDLPQSGIMPEEVPSPSTPPPAPVRDMDFVTSLKAPGGAKPGIKPSTPLEVQLDALGLNPARLSAKGKQLIERTLNNPTFKKLDKNKQAKKIQELYAKHSKAGS